jgi:hypothetical protein
MEVTQEHWRDLYRLFDPKRRLESTDEDLFVERPEAVGERVVADLEFEPSGKWIVCGSLGSGKSSELVRLGRKLWKKYSVVALDLPLSSARVDRLTPAEVLFLIGAAGIRYAKDNAHPVPSQVENQLKEVFKGLVDPQARVNLGEVLQGVALFLGNVAAPGVLPAAGAATGAARVAGGLLGGMTRNIHEGDPALQALAVAVGSVYEKIREKLPPPVVLVDGLDKIQELPTIQSLFTSSRLLATPGVPVIYTGPINLMLSTYWNATGGVFRRERLTNVVVRRPPPEWLPLDEAKIQAGRQAMREVVARRLQRYSLQLADVFEGEALEGLITASGGVLRDMVHLINRCCRFAHEVAKSRPGARIDTTIADEAISELRKEFEVTLTTQRLEELRHVKKAGEPSGNNESSSDLLLNNYVLPYSNGKVWFEPHPILSGSRPDL